MAIRYLMAAVAATFAGAASGQFAGTAGWAVPVGMQSSQTQAVLEMLNGSVSGRPFSGTAVAHMTHTLEDGSHINQTTTTVMYRDAQGRTRNETGGVIDIADPISHTGLRLNAETHEAVRRPIEGKAENGEEPARMESAPRRTAGGSEQSDQTARKKREQREQRDQATQDLGIQTVNGVPAHGFRNKLTIPAGTIGNDRDITVIKETWTSPDLHMLVRSINSDPRFGTSTYDLTNIVQAPPNPSLFQTQPPPGYTVRSNQAMNVQLK